MIKIMTKKAFETSLAAEVEGVELLAETRRQANDELRKRLGECHANLREATKLLDEASKTINEMAPLADAGRRRKLAEEKRNAKTRAKRAAKGAGL